MNTKPENKLTMEDYKENLQEENPEQEHSGEEEMSFEASAEQGNNHEPSSERFRPKNNGLFYRPSVYDKGWWLGVIQAETENFERFIDFREKQLEAEDQINRLEERENRLEKELAENLEKRSTLEAEKAREEEKIANLEKEIEVHQEVIEKEKEKQSRWEQILRDFKPETTLMSALLLIGASIVFIWAEIRITSEIMEEILSMTETGPIFGLAIALTAFALKPAFDRMFEKNYGPSAGKWPMYILLIITSLLVLVTLGFLGFFRVEGKVILDQIDTYSSIDGLANVISRPSVYVVFTLSSILFALAGAIGFGISVPVLHKEWKLFLFRVKNRSSKKKERRERNSTRILRNAIGEGKRIVSSFRIQLDQLISQEILVEEIKSIQSEKANWVEKYFSFRREAERAWFQSSVDEGKKHELRRKLEVYLDSPRVEIRSRQRHSEKRTVREKRQPSDNGNYLHQRLRKLIKYNLD
jgi:hypothetical protein